MSLQNVTEAVTLNGESVFDEEVAVAFSCRIAENGIAGSVSQTIRNYDLYQEKRREVRQDLQEFQMKVWDVEDRMAETE